MNKQKTDFLDIRDKDGNFILVNENAKMINHDESNNTFTVSINDIEPVTRLKKVYDWLAVIHENWDEEAGVVVFQEVYSVDCDFHSNRSIQRFKDAWPTCINFGDLSWHSEPTLEITFRYKTIQTPQEEE